MPWVGFPLSQLLDLVGATADAKYVVFKGITQEDLAGHTSPLSTFFPNMGGASWPYTEAITVEEARSELAFVSTGMYQSPLPPQNGAPLRLTLPWKYGFKSIKFITDIELIGGDMPPSTFWSDANYDEYGFWANVNPEVPHPRWSQATERVLTDTTYSTERIPTQLYNGYEDEIAYLYTDLQGERLFV